MPDPTRRHAPVKLTKGRHLRRLHVSGGPAQPTLGLCVEVRWRVAGLVPRVEGYRITGRDD